MSQFPTRQRKYISGYAGIPGALIHFEGPISGVAGTDNEGIFFIIGLPSGGYTITPSFDGHSFSPPFRKISLNSRNVAGVTFIAS